MTQNRPPQWVPSLGLVLVYGLVSGLLIAGIVGLLSWLLYGDPYGGPLWIWLTVAAGLTLAAGLCACRVLDWLTAPFRRRAR